jgi:hypothetical protein
MTRDGSGTRLRAIFTTCAALLLLSLGFAPPDSAQTRRDQPRYSQSRALVRPQDYREWIYLSSGFGMEYSRESGRPKMFTNVFVTPFAYEQFVKTGKWREQTMFVLEERFAATKGSINKAGRYQAGLAGLAVSVKDSSRFPEQWAYFSFPAIRTTSAPNPKKDCWQCHHSHGAVDNTFVQFYPTLKKVAQNLGVYKEKQTGAPASSRAR